jgi:hypothetical protein
MVDMQGGWQAIRRFLIGNDTFAANNPNIPWFGNHITLSANNKVGIFLATFSDRNEVLLKNWPQFEWTYGSFPIPDGGSRDANYGGSHGLVIPTIAKNRDAAWAWIEFVTSPENNLRFAQRYDRVPVRKSTANSEAFLKGDPFLRLMIDQVDRPVRPGRPALQHGEHHRGHPGEHQPARRDRRQRTPGAGQDRYLLGQLQEVGPNAGRPVWRHSAWSYRPAGDPYPGTIDPPWRQSSTVPSGNACWTRWRSCRRLTATPTPCCAGTTSHAPIATCFQFTHTLPATSPVRLTPHLPITA